LATFLNISIHLFLGLTQALSVYGLWVAIERRQKDAIEWEENLRNNHENNLEKFLAGGHHEDIEVFSNRYMKELSAAWKMKKRWSSKIPEVLSFLFAILHLTLFFMFLEMDFGQAWR